MGTILLAICILYAGLCLTLYIFQERLAFVPSKSVVTTPQAVGLVYEDIYLTSGDERIHAWYVPAEGARLSVLFCHGNAGNISHRLETLSLLSSLGVNVLIFDYAGFGLSEGKASEAQTYHDVEAAWQFLIEDKLVDPGAIVLFGRSLGGAVATWIAAKNEPGGLILESTFISIIAMGKKLYPIFPIRLLARVRYDSAALIEKIKAPKLFIHSRDDETIPFEHGIALYEKAQAQKTFVEIRGGHNSGFLDSGSDYTVPLQSFLKTVESRLDA